MDQGEISEGASHHLHFYSHVAVVPDPDLGLGISVVSSREIRGQIESALANIEAVPSRLLAKNEKAVGYLKISIKNGNEKSALTLLKGVRI